MHAYAWCMLTFHRVVVIIIIIMYTYILTYRLARRERVEPTVEVLESRLENAVLGENAFADDSEQHASVGVTLEDGVPITMVAEDGVDQDEITRSIESPLNYDGGEMARKYDQLPTHNLYLSRLEKMHRQELQGQALALLSRKNRLVIDDEYLVNANDPNLRWTMPGVSSSRAPASDSMVVPARLTASSL